MLDPRYRNPAWVTGQVIDENCECPLWSARFRMTTTDAVEDVKAGFMSAGATRAFTDEDSPHVAVVEFTPVLVRRISAAAVARGGVLVEMARVPPNMDAGRL
jgi:hypothetical protein